MSKSHKSSWLPTPRLSICSQPPLGTVNTLNLGLFHQLREVEPFEVKAPPPRGSQQAQPRLFGGWSSVVFRVPDFVDADGIAYTDIEVIVEMEGDIRDTVQLVKTLERPLTERK